jgi:hypothetical protein
VFAIKYYYGPDIIFYISLYESNASSLNLVRNAFSEAAFGEWGFYYFCALMKFFGASFWTMTAVITVLYFGAVFALFKKVERYRTFALFLLVIMDYNLLAYEYRQCLAVALFIYAIVCLIDKKYTLGIILLLLSATMHKSALFMVVFVVLAFVLRKSLPLSMKTYWLLLVCLIFFTFIPLADVLIFILKYLPINTSSLTSIVHHMEVNVQFQSVFFVYFMVLVCLSFFKQIQMNERWKTIALISMFGLAFIAFFYQNWFLLNRLRSYFLPFIITYCIYAFPQASPNTRILYQLLVVSLMVFGLFTMRTYYVGLQKPENISNETSTVFGLLHKSKAQIRGENLEKAACFWKHYDKYRSSDKKKN